MIKTHRATIEITFEYDDEQSEGDWIVDDCVNEIKSSLEDNDIRNYNLALLPSAELG